MPRLLVKPAGNMVRLTCRAEGNPKPNITWYRDDKSPPTRKLGNIKISPVSLTLEDLVPNDAGNYTCLVCNIVGCINFTFAVDVVERYHNTPILTTGLENSTVIVGESVKLSCMFVSDLHPYIVWTNLPYGYAKCSYEALDDCNAKVLQKSDDGRANPEVYEILNVTHEDEGWYACFASNSLGITVSRAYITVVDNKEVRSHFGQMAMGNINQFKNFIIANCLDNKSSDIEDDLRETFTELETCIQKRKMYVDTKEDYIKNIEDCSKDPIKKVKRCLTKQQSYYPDFILNGVKKQVELVYDDQDVITTYLSSCMKVFERPDVSYGYLKCVEEASTMPSGSLSLPDTVEAFCSQFLPAARCLADVLDKECAQYPKMKKYSKDYVRATEYPCEQEYY
ncbi:fibroblast growth factor receptor 4 isoform X2 [Diabrotica virgifera virgifera]|nr:fibroblast growth factor receptor 4 isoform X2 [Diabrotica virgifera virgifera]